MSDSSAETIDLRDEARPRMAAFATLQEKGTGHPLEFVFADEPTLLMQAVALMLRHRIHWDVSEATPGAYRVRVVDRDTVEPETLTDLLSRDHERLDRLFAVALQHANRGEIAEAAPLIETCREGLRRHIYCENEVLAPHFGIPEGGPESDPTNQMIHEHDNILGELDQIRELTAMEELADASMIAALMGILSGGLAKHEGREEANLFPRWEAALRRSPEPALLERAKAILDGAEDDRIAD
ncbi:MAG TPA: hemerythrin domain-containing protein [Gammaproteobacteria bacterium]|nr:hemerythrin domain-containing protein [Gammaproteobacteria bacterium]